MVRILLWQYTVTLEKLFENFQNTEELSLCQNSDFLIPLTLQQNVVDLRYFMLWNYYIK